jgi:hypothetical protein
MVRWVGRILKDAVVDRVVEWSGNRMRRRCGRGGVRGWVKEGKEKLHSQQPSSVHSHCK